MIFFVQGATYPGPLLTASMLVIVLAFAYHEFAHAIVADWLGDPTPRAHGRISLNPFVHLDMVGLVLVAVTGFGYASTPVTPSMFKGNMRVSHALVAVAGPIANLLMALLFAIPLRFGLVPMEPPTSDMLPSLYMFLEIGVFFNLLLFAFNLLPVPPLDGFTILEGIVPPELAYRLSGLRRYGLILLMLLVFVFPAMEVIIPFIQIIMFIISGQFWPTYL
ncbi:MAG TPA: site-2 protease family protein [Anaerolineae bacterium]|nr:site-2 protease family protein [Anaerolineae bacterium]